MYRNKHFSIEEIAPKEYVRLYGDACWQLFDCRALITLDALRERFGPATVNNYKWGGPWQWRGLRAPEYYGSQEAHNKSRSQHKYGRAFDISFSKISARDARNYVLENKEEFPYITFLEVGDEKEPLSWFHFDVRNCEPITLWSPSLGFVSYERYKKCGGM